MSRSPTSQAVEEALNQESARRTYWANLGLWKDGDIYAAAAERLACAVADAAGLRAGQTVLDLGAGLGQQCALWHSRYAVGSILAVNPDQQQRNRLQAYLQPEDRILCQGAPEALCNLATHSIDVAISVDAAYFISKRQQFWSELARVLRPGSLFAWTDIARSPPPNRLSALGTELAQRSLSLAGIDGQQMHTPHQLQTQLHSLGWSMERREDLTTGVFTGFCQWWQHYRQHYALPRRLRQRCALTAAALQANQRFGWWNYILYVARTPD